MMLTLIIPYYDTYDLTNELLDKLLPQCEGKDVDVILIDDDINKRITREHPNLYIIYNMEKTSCSDARNLGISIAQGKYIGFIDSDDMITDNYIDTLLKAINERDEEVIKFYWMDKHTKKVYAPDNPAVWKAIYKREIVPKFKNIVAEDVPFTNKIEEMIQSRKIKAVIIKQALYYYNSNREGSLWWKQKRGIK